LLTGVFSVLRRSGRWDEALIALDRWKSVDPQGYVAATEAANTYKLLRDFKKAETEMRRAIAIAPDRPDAYYHGALNYVLWDGATDRARRLLESAPSLDSSDVEYELLVLDLYDRKPESAMARLDASSIDGFSLQGWYAPKELLKCMYLSELGESDESEQVCSLAAEGIEHEIDARPQDYRLYVALGHALARLGRFDEAVRSCEHAAELIPIAIDAADGPDQHIEVAKVYTLVGEANKALDLIEELLSIPCQLSVGLLRLDSAWDPLRDNPRFQAILEKYDTD
jgi:serine/threonine-protein kinase